MLEVRPSNHRGHYQPWLAAPRHTFPSGITATPTSKAFRICWSSTTTMFPRSGLWHPRPPRYGNLLLCSTAPWNTRDSMGTGSVIRPGDVQMRRRHRRGAAQRKFNHSARDPVHFLQIWIVPDGSGAAPRYQQVHVDDADKRPPRLIIAP